MNQLNFESPCINNCKLNEVTNICEACGRTIKEIMQWTVMTDEERKEIIKRVWRMDFMKTFLVICLVVTIIAGLYYLVKSLVIVGLLTVIGIGLYFWISKKIKSWI